MTAWNGHQRRGEQTAGASEAGEHHQLCEARVSHRKIQQSMEHSGHWQARRIIFAADKKRGKLVSLLIFRLGLFAPKIFQGRREVCLPSQLKTSQDSNDLPMHTRSGCPHPLPCTAECCAYWNKLPNFQAAEKTERCPKPSEETQRCVNRPSQITGHSLAWMKKEGHIANWFFSSNCLVKSAGFNVFSFVREATCSPSGWLLLPCNSSSWKVVQAGLEVVETPKNPGAWQCRGNLIAASCIQGPYQQFNNTLLWTVKIKLFGRVN